MTAASGSWSCRAPAGRLAARAAIPLLACAALLLVGRHNYLLFHGLVEVFAVFVAWSIFAFTWVLRRELPSCPWVVLGVAYLAVGLLHLLHVLAYRGMGVFAGTATSADLATQLWVAARYLEALSLLGVMLWTPRPVPPAFAAGGYAVATALLLGVIFYWDLFPTCFVEGSGLTPFKRFSEYAVVAVLCAAGILLARQRHRLDPTVLRLLAGAMAATAAAELAFTLYTDPYGISNLLGHLIAALSFWLLYRAVLHTGLSAPQRLLAREHRSRALQQLREAIWDMRSSADFEQVLRTLAGQLRSLGVRLDNLGINLLDDPADSGQYRQYALMGRTRFVSARQGGEQDSSVVRIWSQHRPVVRHDIDALDPFEERPGLRRSGSTVRSLVDVPLPGGTLAMSSSRPQAFVESDVGILCDMATVLASGVLRLGDLERLEQRNHELAREITERLRLEEGLVRTERQHAAAQLSAGVSHNFYNLLTAVLGPAQLLKRRSADPGVLQQADAILAAAQRARFFVQRLSEAVQPHTDAPAEPISLNEQVEAAVALARPYWQDLPPTRGIDVVLRLGDVPRIRGSEAEVRDALLALLRNALEAMPEGGTITLSTASDGGGVTFSCSDTGVGMDVATRRRALEPFFTTKGDVGSGLGLALLQGTVVRLGGTVDLVSAPGRGATVTLWLPNADTPAGTASSASHRLDDGAPSCLLLVVQDAAMGRRLQRTLAVTSRVEMVCCARDAIDRFVPGWFDVACIDLHLSDPPGDGVACRLRQLDPALATVAISHLDLDARDPRLREYDACLRWPGDNPQQLEAVVRRAVVIHDARAAAEDRGAEGPGVDGAQRGDTPRLTRR